MSFISEGGGAANAGSVSPSRKQRRSRISQSVLESTPWTATRCHRLIRPLLSHITALQKEMSWPSNDAALAGVTSEASREALSGPSPGPTSCSPRQAWVAAASTAAARRGRNMQTYSTRGSRQRTGQRTQPRSSDDNEAPSSSSSQAFANKACIWSDTAMPTPIVRKIRYHQLSSPVGPPRPPPKFTVDVDDSADRPLQGGRRAASTAPARSAVEEDLAGLRRTTPACVFNMYEAILRATESLLRATAEPAAASERATAPVLVARKSLFAMCLRQVPAYIAGRQEWEREEAEARGEKAAFNPSEVSFGIYSELEGLGPGDGAGYRHLRVVVRAHGIRILRDAVEQGILADAAFCAALARLCLLSNAGSEAEEILRAALVQAPPFPGPTGPDSTLGESPVLAPVRLLLTVAETSKRDAFALREMANLLSSGKLPQEWMCTSVFRKLWATVVRAISSNGPCQGAMEFAKVSLNIICKHVNRRNRKSSSKQDDENSGAWERTLDSSLASLATMLTVGHESLAKPEASSSRHEKIAIITKRVRVILHSSLAASTGRGIRQFGGGVFLLLLTLYLSTSPDLANDATEAAVRERLELLWEESSGARTSQHHGRAVKLISSIAQCCGRGTSSASSTYLLGLCGRVHALDVDGELFDKLEADCAFSLAHRTNDLRDLAFAETLSQSRAGAGGLVDETAEASGDGSSAPNIFTGYKWDDGISEWVLKTPAPRKPQMPPASRSHSGSNRIGSITSRRCRTASPAVSHPETPPQAGRRRALRSQTADAAESSAEDCSYDDSNEYDELSFDSSFNCRKNPTLKRRRAATVVARGPPRRVGESRPVSTTVMLSLRSHGNSNDRRGAAAGVPRKRMRPSLDSEQSSDDELCM
ncbi:hypothetical protein GGTG_09529 [Gaeumannomyces tritici R3-111a-1]|uniref:Uncharacterized protein n=1 Tax=Gaeumannomyces tritici (strain R3-111a-1) TaxID=644352 RepID=J3P7N8_GAET3|nr:hypothetical protein GGTG_09529 [Gaeumannomyces tritici R3-111a-1]EJT72670.1 hypothetical protein GGTG_09529 [Gaeumannomyces tritici R3-111a-1]